MTTDAVPFWAWCVGTVLIVLVCVEVGFRLGRNVHHRKTHELEAPASAMAGAILGLVAFMLAFTFGIAANRYDSRKSLVLEEANAIRTAWTRSEFLPETDRAETADLLRSYMNDRLEVALSKDWSRVAVMLGDASRIQKRLWEIAVANARKDMNSDVAALYIESLNDVIASHASRVAIGWQARIPFGIWAVLYALVGLGMIGIGYQTGIAGSPRSWGAPVLAISFSIVIVLIAALDRPGNALISVPQQPLMNLKAEMTAQEPS